MAELQLVLVRHGEAERRAASDEVRALTGQGRAEVAATAARLAALGLQAPLVVSSSLRRAQETGAIIAAALGLAAPVPAVPGFTPDDDPRRATESLARLAGTGHTLVVATHMPLIASLAAWLEDGVLRPGHPVETAGAIILAGTWVAAGQMRVVGRLSPSAG